MFRAVINISMDCERLHGESACRGPADRETSEHSILHFFSLCKKFGFIPDFYVTPSAAALHQKLWQQLAGEGARLGLHLHLPSFSQKYRFQKLEITQIPFAESELILTAAVQTFTEKLGIRPQHFRAGMGALHREHYPVLSQLGIKTSSSAMSGQILKRFLCDWSQTPILPHFAENTPNPLLEIPLFNDLWIDRKPCPRLQQSLEDTQPYYTFYTHNWVDFSPGSFAENELRRILRHFRNRRASFQSAQTIYDHRKILLKKA